MLTCYIQGSSLCPRITTSPKRSSLIQFSGEVKKWLDWECMCCVLCAKLLQLCPTLCSPMDCSPPGSSVHAILQARILEWVAMPSSRGSSGSRDQTHVCLHLLHCRQILYPLSHLRSPMECYSAIKSYN